MTLKKNPTEGLNGPAIKRRTFIFYAASLREDTHKKRLFFSVVGPIRFYPPYTNGLVVHATFLCVSSRREDGNCKKNS